MVVQQAFRGDAVLWGLISITVVSLLSLTGAAILPLIKGTSRSRWMHVFIALAVATLSSDAILHILPQVLGVHNDHRHSERNTEADGIIAGHEEASELNNMTVVEHDCDHDHAHEREHSLSQREVLTKLSAVLFAIYVLYIVEFVASRGLRKRSRKVHHHDTASNNSQNSWADVEKPIDQIINGQAKTSSGLSNDPIVFCGLRSTAVMILFGDGVHNFIDGVAVGASFAVSHRLGLTTSIAVVCHELPHEVGDFAVLLESGLSVRRALVLNLLSALTAFAGLFVGLASINIESALDWLLALIAGMFLYVAWLDMLVHLRAEVTKSDPWYLTLILQSFGFIGGFIIIFVIGWFEDDILAL